MARINESVRRVLQLKQDLGLFDNPYVEKEAIANFGLPGYQTVALETARESMTLLKNKDQVLPLSKSKKIFVTGPGAASLTTLNGAWSYSWQGTNSAYFDKNQLTILAAVKQKAKDVTYELGTDFKGNDQIAAAVAAAKGSDQIVVCLGEDAYAETPGNIEDLELPENQLKLVMELSKLKIPIIAVFTEGRPRLIRKIEPLLSGIILAYWPGVKGADAIADVLFGDYNPSGKLPITYPRNPNSIATYDHKYLDEVFESASPQIYSEEFNPQFAFGFGLSYTNYTYSDLRFSSEKLTATKPINVTISITNSGKMDGKETVEMYSSDLIASITPSVRRLRDFKKVALEAGQTKEVSFTIFAKDLAFINKNLEWTTEPGEFNITIAGKTKKLTYAEK